MNIVIEPVLNIIDGFIVSENVNITTMWTEKPFALNTILASKVPLAFDCIATKIAGINLFDTIYLKHAAERKVGESDYNRIKVKGNFLDFIIN